MQIHYKQSVLLVIISIFGLMLTSIYPKPLYGQHYASTSFNHERNFPQPYIYTINQDNGGYLWIGTGNGLVKYNGYSFETFTTADSLAANFINCSFNTSQGILFGHRNGDISFYNGKKFTPYVLGLDHKSMVTDMEKDLKGNVLFSYYSGHFFSYAPSGEIKKLVFNGNVPTKTTSFKPMGDKQLLVGTDFGLFVYDYNGADRLNFKKKVLEIPAEKITDIIELPESNSFLVATLNSGIFKLSYNYAGIVVNKLNFNADHKLNSIQRLALDKRKGLWVACMGQGLLKLSITADNRLIIKEEFNAANGNEADYVKSVFVDREGIVWSGTYGYGLSKYIRKPYSYVFFDENGSNNISAIAVDDDKLWIGNDKGLVAINKRVNGAVSSDDKEAYLEDKQVTTLLNSKEKIWIGTKNSGVYKYIKETKYTEPSHTFQGRLENSITTIEEGKSGLWIGTLKGLYHVDNAGWINNYTISERGLPNNHINQILLDKNDELWVATTTNTYSRIKNGEVWNTALSIGSKISIISCITQDSENNIWLGTLGNGVFKLENNNLRHFTTDKGLFSNYCYSIAFDNKENIWVGHHGGISRINENTSHVSAIAEAFEIHKDFEFNDRAIATDNNNTVYFGFNKGILKVKEYDRTAPLPPLLALTGIKVNDREVPLKDEIRLRAGNYKISFDFIGASLKEPLKTNYHYFLKGFDDTTKVSSETSIVYPQLQSGDYVFSIKAISSDGIQSDESIQVKVSIKPPLWKLPWFYVVLVLIILVFFLWRNSQQKRLIKEKNIILEEKVELRTSEILNQKKQIEKQIKLINKKNLDITDSIKYASKIQNAILPSFYRVNSLIPQNFILNKPKDIVSGDFYWVKNIGTKLIVAAADCTGHGVPGAFMSLLGITYLNEIVQHEKTLKPNLILNELRDKIIQSLNQLAEDDEPKDGMDMAICVIDVEEKTLQYSGAYNSLYVIRKTNGVAELKEIKADRMPVGIHYGESRSFTNNLIEIVDGDAFYIFSDGYADQLGGVGNKKYMHKNFKNLLLDICALPMDEQGKVLNATIKEWMHGEEQVDDILVVGFKIDALTKN